MTLELDIDPNDPCSSIKNVCTGSNSTIICIVITLKNNPDTFIVWDMEQSLESDIFEVEDEKLLLWDCHGQPYIATENKLIFPEQRCAVKAYDYDGLIKKLNQRESQLSTHFGHRVDGKNHNWLVFEEYLSLSFSYLAFVIRDKIENGLQKEGRYFDTEPYNYICQKSSSFIDGDIVTADHLMLKNVLDNFDRIDPSLLEIINYTNYHIDESGNKVYNSALHKAFYEGNQRSIDVLLSFMCKMQYNSVNNYLSIMPNLVDQLKFYDYFTCYKKQTSAMISKQVLRANETYNSTIVHMAQSASAYIDQHFFSNKMNDSPTNLHSYPVNIVSVKVGWLVKDP